MRSKVLWLWLVMLGSMLKVNYALAGEVEIVKAKFIQVKKGTWTISVTLKHADEGWKHFANAWRVVNEKSDILGERVLGHPHVDEQPFTRSLKNVVIPMSSQTVFIEARDSKHGWAENRLEVNLDKAIAGHLVIKPE